jgi:hypothetical protein
VPGNVGAPDALIDVLEALRCAPQPAIAAR